MIKEKLIWTILRTLIFIIIGLMNTIWAKQEDIGSWKNYIGYAFLLIAIFDIFYLIMNSITRDEG